jgi:hypothetical protein
MAIDERNITYDFGFTIVDESELDAYQQAQEAKEQLDAVSGSSAEMEARLNKLFNAIQPLLANLKKSPERDYILWPDRLNKIEAFEDMLQDIYQGKQ